MIFSLYYISIMFMFGVKILIVNLGCLYFNATFNNISKGFRLRVTDTTGLEPDQSLSSV